MIKNKFLEYLKSKIAVLPNKPGVYQYFDESGKIIYVGKAKNLKRRVSSYFNKQHDSAKTALLVRKIADIQHIIVDSEEDALLLENNLIKKYQPRYNVLLKDDKSYPWICVKSERFPRVFKTRNVVKDGSLYFGPYTSVGMVNTLLELIKQLYPVRTCNYNLSEANISNGNFKVCLEYHIGNCFGPCVGEIDEESYNKNIAAVKNILRGNIREVTDFVRKEMQELASEYRFEEAQVLKGKLDLLESYQSKSTIVNPRIHNVDVFSYLEDEESAYVNFMKVVNGAIIQAHTMEFRKRVEEQSQDLLQMAIIEIRQRLYSTSREIIVPFDPDIELENVKWIIPQKGDKKKLLELSERNVKYYRVEKFKQYDKLNPAQRTTKLLTGVKKDLHLHELPVHIECFDNSNIQGHYPVAACVVFKNGKPSKKDYRHFHVKTVEGPDDFASMEEVVYRRYSRLLQEKSPLPQLIVVDGGKGQLGSALTALERLDLRGRVPIIGIAKRLEEIYFPGDSIPIYLDKNSPTLRLIQNLRDEAHRFGITFHRKQRSKGFIKSELDSIKGIGDKLKEKLLSRFKSVEKVKEASLVDLEETIGKAKGRLVYDYFRSKDLPDGAN